MISLFEYLIVPHLASRGVCKLHSFVSLQWLKQQEGKGYPKRDMDEKAHIFSGMMIALSGRMSRSHVLCLNVARFYIRLKVLHDLNMLVKKLQAYFKEQILKHGGKVNNSVLGGYHVL
jgi:poly [ADP-ribose] polymerase